MFFLFSAILFPLALAQTCQNPNGEGPCLMGSCPGGTTCLQDGSADGVCCQNTQIIPPTSPAPPTLPPTAPPTGTTAAPTAGVTNGPTAAPGTGATTGPCVDKINPNTGTSDCPKMAAYCTNSAYYQLMTDQCPKTCGRCTSTGATSSTGCVDKINPSTGTSDCPKMAAYCTNSQYYDLMTDQCPKTCGRCSGTATTASSTCVDKINPSTGTSDCPKMAAYCNNSAYYQLMTDQCPKTCARCNGGTATSATTVSSTCVDKVNANTGVSDCPNMTAYCNNSAYYDLMTQQCPRTCGRCSG